MNRSFILPPISDLPIPEGCSKLFSIDVVTPTPNTPLFQAKSPTTPPYACDQPFDPSYPASYYPYSSLQSSVPQTVTSNAQNMHTVMITPQAIQCSSSTQNMPQLQQISNIPQFHVPQERPLVQLMESSQDLQSFSSSQQALKSAMKDPKNKPSKPQKVGKGPWTTTEDKLLLDSMASFSGHICWEELSKRIPGRSAKQCRERWQFRLHPDVNKAPFEPWEDEMIINERVIMGNHWTQIASKLPGRTSCSVKNRWYTVLRHRKPDQTTRRAKVLSIQTTPFYMETLMLRDRKELWERNHEAHLSTKDTKEVCVA
ncbi:hypothetical protein TRFO_02059 [Tritrichomonas foetus]|uniref:Myb-like DNA-binding domain containing protein n=1 Tax=Tritrichomonas foetus TaxID=1144522 RepID=A0A1J4JH56_9EUKA|nr:hypothetical protein TRFO_02059 [Tritrichomonas foetus]|eukprot:OHS96931.1 hypothetical protein TRFO_02059 [Tritrichomonas foetus]